MKHYLLILIFVSFSLADEEEDFSRFLDLELQEKGSQLYQTIPDSNGKQYFLLKQIFPAGTSTNYDEDLDVYSPSLSSTLDGVNKDGKYRLFASLGNVIVGPSEDTSNFRLRAGFFTSARKSLYRIRGIRTRRTPISTPKDF